MRQAELYMTFGRNVQALKALEAAIQAHPEREDLRIKLGEIKKLPPAENPVSIRQCAIFVVLIILAAGLKLLNYSSWLNTLASWLGWSAHIYFSLCLLWGRRAKNGKGK
ncbi:type IV pilus assembly protein FimV [Undibacterium curvum]|uniref:type IV pilus assembly protein FimV n=1 Tax=Undibacterium curvum TaxID=2762294 RepID=UPI003D13BFE8